MSKHDPLSSSPSWLRGPRGGSILLRGSLLGLALLASPAPLLAQGSWSDEFDRPGLVSRAYTVSTFQGDLVAGGPGFEADGHVLGFCARFDGTHWQPLGAGIYSSSGNPYVRHHVGVFTEYQGELIAAGQFTSAGNKPVYSIARWDGAQWHALGSGIPGIVRAAVVYQGELYVAGEFDSAGGVAVHNIARWNGAIWQDVGGGLDKPYDPEVYDLLVGPDGRLYASGEFDTAGGLLVDNVATWNGSAWSALGGGLPGPLNARVFALEWFQGRLFAGGNFDLVPGGQDHEKVASWNGTSWKAEGSFDDGPIVGTSVNELRVYGSDLYALGNVLDANGVAVTRVARFDGLQWSAVGGVSGSDVETDIWGATVWSGKLVVAGEFSVASPSAAAGGSVVTNSVAAFTGSGWEGVGAGLGFNAGVSDVVAWNGGIVAVGGFTQAGAAVVGGSNLWAGPVFFDGNGWTSLGSFNGQVRTAMVWNGDLIVAGSFTQVDGQAIQGVARYDGSQWTGYGAGFGVSADRAALAVYQGQLYAGGTGGVMRWNGASWKSFAPQLFGHVNVLHEHQGILYIGGSMWGDGHLVSWDGTTQQTVGGGTSQSVEALASFQGQLLVGGWFGLLTWDGSSFAPFPGITGSLVQSLVLFQGELHASGNLIGGTSLPPNKYLARWDGSGWRALGAGIDGQASTMVADDVGGHLWVGGLIHTAGGVPSWRFARWDTTPTVLGTIYCSPAQPNSTGQPSTLKATGSPFVAQNDVTFTVSGLPQGHLGMFLMSPTQASIPFSQGILCLGPPWTRFNEFILSSGPGGSVTFSPDLASGLPAGVTIQPGDTWNFTFWHRDGTASNFSDAVSILFQ